MKTERMTGRIQKNYNLTIPKKAREIFNIETGDFLEFKIQKNGILLEPKKLVDSTQMYFWTDEWQKGEAEADEDIKAGRVSKTRNTEELIKKLKE